jgi:hypothetical protein
MGGHLATGPGCRHRVAGVRSCTAVYRSAAWRPGPCWPGRTRRDECIKQQAFVPGVFVVAGHTGQRSCCQSCSACASAPAGRLVPAGKKRGRCRRGARHGVMAELLQRVQHQRHGPARKAPPPAATHGRGRPAQRHRRRPRPATRPVHPAGAAAGQASSTSGACSPAPAARHRASGAGGGQAPGAGSGCARWAAGLGSAAVSSSRMPAGRFFQRLQQRVGRCRFSASAGCSSTTLPRPRDEVLWTQSMAARTRRCDLAAGLALALVHRRRPCRRSFAASRPAARARSSGSSTSRSGWPCDCTRWQAAAAAAGCRCRVPAQTLRTARLGASTSANSSAPTPGCTVQQQRMAALRSQRRPAGRPARAAAVAVFAHHQTRHATRAAPSGPDCCRGLDRSARASMRAKRAGSAAARRFVAGRAPVEEGQVLASKRSARAPPHAARRPRRPAGRTTASGRAAALLHPGFQCASTCGRSRGRRPGRQRWRR